MSSPCPFLPCSSSREQPNIPEKITGCAVELFLVFLSWDLLSCGVVCWFLDNLPRNPGVRALKQGRQQDQSAGRVMPGWTVQVLGYSWERLFKGRECMTRTSILRWILNQSQIHPAFLPDDALNDASKYLRGPKAASQAGRAAKEWNEHFQAALRRKIYRNSTRPTSVSSNNRAFAPRSAGI